MDLPPPPLFTFSRPGFPFLPSPFVQKSPGKQGGRMTRNAGLKKRHEQTLG